MKWWNKELKLGGSRDVDYHVRVEDYEAGEYDLIFDTREQARLYKKCLRNSRRQLTAHILRRTYSDQFIAEEIEVF